MYIAFYLESWSGSKEADYFIESINADNLEAATEKWHSEHSSDYILVKIHHFFPGRRMRFGVQDQDEFRFTDAFYPG